MLLIARIVRFVFAIVVAVIVLAIVLRLANATPSNTIVHNVHRAGYDFVGPFRNLFTIHDQKVAMTVNWGVAAIVISMIGELIVRLLIGLSPQGRRLSASV